MANIYISHARRDSNLAEQVRTALVGAGQNVFKYSSERPLGSDWSAELGDALRNADIILALITENSETSKSFTSEINAARAYQQARGDLVLIPVVVGQAGLPSILADIQAISSPMGDPDDIARQVL